MTSLAAQHLAERLLRQIRASVAELRRLEQTRTERSELRRRRCEITELQGQLARFVSHHPGGGNLAA